MPGNGSLSLVCFLACIGALVLCQSSNNGTCPDGSTVETWSQWTCNQTEKTSYRTGSCDDANGTIVVQSEKGPVISWSPWSDWYPSCGLGVEVQDRSQNCVVPSSEVPYCSDCGAQNHSQHQFQNAQLPPCCEDLEYGTWSSWLPGCGELPLDSVSTQSRGRSRDCTGHSNCPPCPLDQETRTAVVTSWGEWGEWSRHLRPCAERAYRARQRFCPDATNQDGRPVQSCCVGSSKEYSCCGGVLQLEKQSCTNTSCLYECINVSSPLVQGAPLPMDTMHVCLEDPPTCDTLGDQQNISLPVPMTTEPPLPVYVWPIIVLAVVSVVVMLVAMVIVILCYKSYRKYKHSYQLMSRRKELEGVYGHIALGSSKATSVAPSSTKELRKDQGEFWSNPLHGSSEVEVHPETRATSYYGDDDDDGDDDDRRVIISDGDGEVMFSNQDDDSDPYHQGNGGHIEVAQEEVYDDEEEKEDIAGTGGYRDDYPDEPADSDHHGDDDDDDDDDRHGDCDSHNDGDGRDSDGETDGIHQGQNDQQGVTLEWKTFDSEDDGNQGNSNNGGDDETYTA